MRMIKFIRRLFRRKENNNWQVSTPIYLEGGDMFIATLAYENKNKNAVKQNLEI